MDKKRTRRDSAKSGIGSSSPVVDDATPKHHTDGNINNNKVEPVQQSPRSLSHVSPASLSSSIRLPVDPLDPFCSQSVAQLVKVQPSAESHAVPDLSCSQSVVPNAKLIPGRASQMRAAKPQPSGEGQFHGLPVQARGTKTQPSPVDHPCNPYLARGAELIPAWAAQATGAMSQPLAEGKPHGASKSIQALTLQVGGAETQPYPIGQPSVSGHSYNPSVPGSANLIPAWAVQARGAMIQAPAQAWDLQAKGAIPYLYPIVEPHGSVNLIPVSPAWGVQARVPMIQPPAQGEHHGSANLIPAWAVEARGSRIQQPSAAWTLQGRCAESQPYLVGEPHGHYFNPSIPGSVNIVPARAVQARAAVVQPPLEALSWSPFVAGSAGLNPALALQAQTANIQPYLIGDPADHSFSPSMASGAEVAPAWAVQASNVLTQQQGVTNMIPAWGFQMISPNTRPSPVGKPSVIPARATQLGVAKTQPSAKGVVINGNTSSAQLSTKVPRVTSKDYSAKASKSVPRTQVDGTMVNAAHATNSKKGSALASLKETNKNHMFHITCKGDIASAATKLRPLGVRCPLCNIDLAFMATGSSSNGDPPKTAILSCGHCFHIDCLEQVGCLPESCEDPPCISCSSTL